MTRVATAAILLLALCACGDENSLSGSAERSYDLDFDRQRFLLLDDSLVVEYLRELEPASVDRRFETDTEKVCKLVVDLAGLDTSRSVKLRDEDFLERVVVSRIARSGGDFPDTESGALRLSKLRPEAGERVNGEFDVIFATGSTLSGRFSGRLQPAEFPP